MATTRTGVPIRQLQRILYQAARLQSTSSSAATPEVPPQTKPYTAQIASSHLSKTPLVTYTRGKHVKLAGSNNKLVDFASSNITGAKSNDDVTAAEAFAVGKFGLGRQFDRHLDGQDVQDVVTIKLSYLHKKPTASLVMGSFSDSISCWLNKLGKEDVVVMDGALNVQTKGCAAPVASFGSVLDMISIFEKFGYPTTGQRLILVHIGSSADDILKLKAVCELAEEYQAVVVACDPHGVIMMRNIIGDFQDNLDILKKPLVIHSSFDSFIGQSSMSYVTGPKSFMQWYKQCLSESQKMVPAYMVSKVHKVISGSDQLAGKLCQSLFSNIQLKHKLWDAGIAVKCEAVSLFLGIEDEGCVQCAREQLKNEGFHIGAIHKANKSGLKVNISPAHSPADIQTLAEALGRALKPPGHITKQMLSVTNDRTASDHMTICSTNQVMLEVSSIRRTEMGRSIVHDIDIAVPLQVQQDSVVNSDPDAGSNERFFTDNAPLMPTSLLNPKFQKQDMALLEAFYFDHLKPGVGGTNPDEFLR